MYGLRGLTHWLDSRSLRYAVGAQMWGCSGMLEYVASVVRIDFKMTLAHGVTGGLITLLAIAGIKLVIKTVDECAYIEAAMDAPHWAIRLVVRVAKRSGWEPMPEWECPAEMLPNNRARVWLAQIV